MHLQMELLLGNNTKMQKLQLQWNANCKCGQLFILGFTHSAENIQARDKKKLSKEQGNQTRKKFSHTSRPKELAPLQQTF